MTEPAALALRLDRDAAETLPVQLAGQVRDLVMARTLTPGQRLPSSRALAAELSVARAVVEAAFDQLHAEGWVTTRRGAGTFVDDVGLRPDRERVRARRSVPGGGDSAARARQLRHRDAVRRSASPGRMAPSLAGDVHDHAAPRLPGAGGSARAARPAGGASRPDPRAHVRGRQRARHGGDDPRSVPASRCDVGRRTGASEGGRDRGPRLPGRGCRGADRRLRRRRRSRSTRPASTSTHCATSPATTSRPST